MSDPSPLIHARDALEGERDLSVEEVSERARVPVSIVERIFAAAERMNDDGCYGEDDIEYAEAISGLLDAYPLEAVERAVRVRNRALTGVVVNDLALVRDHVIRPALERGTGVDEIARKLGETARDIVPLASTTLPLDYRRILLRMLDLEVVEQAAREGADDRVMLAVGFVDVVGFTALSARIDPTGLGDVLGVFEDLVSRIVDRYEHVMLVKFLGDAAMLVAQDPADLAHALHAIATDDGPVDDLPRSAGMSAGPILIREGDYFGDPVNVAARLTDHARPGSLLADEELADVLEERFELTRIPPIKLRGIGSRRPLRIRV